MKKKFIVVVLVLCQIIIPILILTCNPKKSKSAPPPNPNAIYIDSDISVKGGTVIVLIDPKHNNICYYATSHGYGETAPSITCMPNK